MSFDPKTGQSRNSSGYNISKWDVPIAADETNGAVFRAGSASSARPQEIEVIIAGTFSGTIELQGAPISSDIGDNTKWAKIKSYTEASASRNEIATCVAPQALRLYSTAWTSGTAYTSLIWGRDDGKNQT